ncbi:ABC transporter permease [Micrococcus sp. M4NT]|uniref:ABC transporter permease n=1 Tax=Micrococcus sp. M4NT TaxID=2957501 RepID=UPI0029B53183|nr:ABC transporter permease [Micrococcus sp. M4NT]MDX2340079.1 ABC transporter permease [Micrococcus sp. M4NT]
MFLALRDLRFATGRFALMGSVVALITLLLVMLSGLTGGLGAQSTAALDDLGEQGTQRIVFGGAAGQAAEAGFTQSEFTLAQRDAWAAADGVSAVEPLGVSQGRLVGLEHAVALPADAPAGPARVNTDGVPTTGVAAAALLGLQEGSAHLPAALDAGQIVLSASLSEELGQGVGGTVASSGVQLSVAAVVPDSFYSHTPVAWVGTDDWAALAHADSADVLGTVGLASFDDGADADATASAADSAAGTVSTTVSGAYAALPAYSSEHGSLVMMQGFLYGISALVVIAFLSIWTVQRTREIAVLKALGGSTGWVLRDALVQAGIVLALGVAVGTLAAFGLGRLAAAAVPFLSSAGTTVLPALGVLALGMLGAGLAVARVTRVDPLVALGGS